MPGANYLGFSHAEGIVVYMRFVIKLLISVCIIALCSQIGRRVPTLAGLIAVMPLTGLIVLVWLYLDNPGNFNLMTEYTKGVLWGIVPSVLFFLVAFLCFHKKLSLWIVLCASFAVWLVAAFIHQLLLK
ncbi:MAG: DUF3147 family protein [Sedimentisphaerales bacterium]